MSAPRIRRIALLLGGLLGTVLAACTASEIGSPDSGKRLTDAPTPKFWTNDQGGTPYWYEIQAITSVNGALWSNCTYGSIQYANHGWYAGGDSLYFYTLDAGCQGSHYFNGGWVRVNEIYAGDTTFLGSVDGNLTLKRFWYPGAMRTVILEAVPYSPADNRTCYFTGFDGYVSSQNPITVAADGVLPLAHFDCWQS